MLGGTYNPKYIPKGYRNATANAPHYFLAFKKDNPGLFDETTETTLLLIVRDKRNKKQTILGEITKTFPNKGVAEVRYRGLPAKRKTRKRS